MSQLDAQSPNARKSDSSFVNKSPEEKIA